jgi:hypothetical protein
MEKIFVAMPSQTTENGYHPINARIHSHAMLWGTKKEISLQPDYASKGTPWNEG